MIHWVHEELVAWGQWAARVEDKKGDYPGQVPYLRLRPDGVSARRDHPFERMPDDFAVVDGAIQELIAPLQRAVLVFYRGVAHCRPLNRRAAMAHLNISRQGLDDRLSSAHSFLAGRISKQAVAVRGEPGRD